jgi:hypothetical protein
MPDKITSIRVHESTVSYLKKFAKYGETIEQVILELTEK